MFIRHRIWYYNKSVSEADVFILPNIYSINIIEMEFELRLLQNYGIMILRIRYYVGLR